MISQSRKTKEQEGLLSAWELTETSASMTLGDAMIDRFSREEASKSVCVRFNSYPHFLSKLSVYLPQLRLALRVVVNTTLKTTTLTSSILLTINKLIFTGALIAQRVMPTIILTRIWKSPSIVDLSLGPQSKSSGNQLSQRSLNFIAKIRLISANSEYGSAKCLPRLRTKKNHTIKKLKKSLEKK